MSLVEKIHTVLDDVKADIAKIEGFPSVLWDRIETLFESKKDDVAADLTLTATSLTTPADPLPENSVMVLHEIDTKSQGQMDIPSAKVPVETVLPPVTGPSSASAVTQVPPTATPALSDVTAADPATAAADLKASKENT